jgi:alpha-glucosidase
LLILLTLRGTPVLYQGDELGLEQTHVAPERARDVDDRDGCRTPLPWTPGGGWMDPWLPLGDTVRNVADERADPESTLSFVRALLARRRASEDLRSGAYEPLPAPARVWAYRRGASVVVAVNLSDEPATFDGHRLPPWDGIVLDV